MGYKNIAASLLFIVFAFLAQPAAAGELLIGAKAGIIDPDFDGTEDDDPFAAVTLGIGYEFLDMVAVDIGAELEYTSSLTDGKLGPADAEYSYESLGLIFSLRTAGPVYFIGRAGYLDQSFDFDATSIDDIDDDATVIGAGIGFSTGIRWEIQLDSYSYNNSDDITGADGSAYYLNVGLSF